VHHMERKNRRDFLILAGSLLFILLSINCSFSQAQENARNSILLRTGWDVETYGDLAAIPAIYRSIQRFVPKTEVIIWPSEMTDELRSLLETGFTQLKMVEGEINEAGEPTTEELKEAFESSNLFLYAAGVHRKIDWTGNDPEGTETTSISYCRKMNIPYVIYGLGEIPETQEVQTAFMNILNGASLSFVTESRSAGQIKDLKLKIENLKSGPSPLFAFDMKNDTGARNYIEDSGIVDHDFIAVNFRNTSHSETDDDSPVKKILFILNNWAQSTDHLILLIADSREDIEYMKKIYGDLPETVKSKTIVFDAVFSPDMISSVLEKSRITIAMSPYPLFSALLTDIPIFHLADWNYNTDGQIFIDLGLKDYVMDINSTPEQDLLKAMVNINDSYVKALIETNKSHNEVLKELQESFQNISQILLKINPVPKGKEKKPKKTKE
jgi:hypothetical protein